MKLIFIPGAGGTSLVWNYQTNYFADSVAIDLPGHPDGSPCTSIEAYADWLHQHILEADYSELILVGHSMGGAIAQTYALKYPEKLRGLVLIGTGGRLRVDPQFLGLIEDGIDDPSSWISNVVEINYSKVATLLKDRVVKEVAVIGARVQLNDFRCCDQFDIMDKLPQIQTPTLIICGSEDQKTPVKYSKYLADKIAGAQLRIIDGSTHVAFMEKPDEVNRAIERFLCGL